ncbi:MULTISPECIES: AarF/ABC1/UbiB kinase family protein [unclassified Acidovorax]|uniref:ABC1 kinase family protein n=1 Tax=unclassified Acidovorax TaxID=2684926 RepID=UPI001C483168|nr:MULTISPECIES: AarF/ABC1/UbiB kinase family protein [unclassified Acidovorax]MBV7430357.1 AarF/ABC1/UbiB kinase family protein [Acidovorax sp. sif0732]MBV7451750.1 AarF/ABC1/UbiB kinase family protein [Acidovorax sp. sif0715]
MARADPPRTSRLARGTITGLAAARIGMAQLGHRVRSTPSAQAQADHEAALGRILFGALGQLRGSALKVSQLLSMHPGLLPDGVRQELARAHHQAPPLNRALVGRVFRQAFGQEPEALFDHFEPTAFAAASLGQVHRAQLAGHGTVAVKVQYPGIAATIASDMQLMRTALRALAHTDMPLPASTVVDGVMAEIEATLLREVDYLQEAEQLQWFAQHAALPGVVLARPILSHTRAHVLTQQFLPGQHLQAWLATQPTQQQRDQAGQHLWDWFMHCTFVLGRVHADPHPGNFLFTPDGTVGVLDFGCTRSLSDGFRAQVTQAWSALLRPPSDPQRDALVLQAYQALGLVNAGLSVPAYAAELAPALADMQAWQMEPFTQAVFDFGAKTPPPITAGRHQRVLGDHLVQVPGEMPAFERMWMGLMHLLTGLGARVRTHCPALLSS